MDYKESLKQMEVAIEKLRELNKEIPILVEGTKDVEALHELGMEGEIITIYHGIEIANLCDNIAAKFNEIIILTDWDRRGWQLCKKIVKNLKGRTKCNTEFHKIFAEYSMVKDVEGIPSFIKKLRAKIYLNEL